MVQLIEQHLSSKSINVLMGTEIDASKLTSSLTLFREVASFLDSETGARLHNFTDLKKSCDNIFAMIAKQGFFPCEQTQSYLESHMRHGLARTVITPSVAQTSLFEPPVILKTNHDEPPVTSVENKRSAEVISPLISQLQGYIDMRRNEWSFHYNFLGVVSFIYLIMDTFSGTDHFHKKSRDVKINAATKLQQLLDPTAPEPNTNLTDAEVAALKEGRLGVLVAGHGELESLIKNAPKKPIVEDSSAMRFGV
ncbi:hypothetical protein TUM19329_32670 [Legionella antarctica]|uniref:Uncharacterized protein n=2 Tax=Legionella antarctica TaxID=2708020 RepID=A0A6F8TA96_9GAMM|nr:hypothetical protein TUM19329_32670 [Legionella antarctica]